jgi:hypothetical protein
MVSNTPQHIKIKMMIFVIYGIYPQLQLHGV